MKMQNIKVNLACVVVAPLILMGGLQQSVSGQSRREVPDENTAPVVQTSQVARLQAPTQDDLPDYDTRGYSAMLSNAFGRSLYGYSQGRSELPCDGCRQCARRGCLTCRCQRQFCPPLSPQGSGVLPTLNAQVTSGLAAQLIFNQLHFTPTDDESTWRLSAAGYERLFKVTKLLQQYPGMVIVETTRDPDVDEQRKELVTRMLMQTGAIAGADQVVVGLPRVAGMSGLEAQINYQKLLMSTMNSQNSSNNNNGLNSGSNGNNSTPSISPIFPNR